MALQKARPPNVIGQEGCGERGRFSTFDLFLFLRPKVLSSITFFWMFFTSFFDLGGILADLSSSEAIKDPVHAWFFYHLLSPLSPLCLSWRSPSLPLR
jgi:hypothetical protein